MSYLARTMQALAGMEAVRPLAPAVIVSVIFAALARWVRGVTVGGAIAGAGICCLLYLGAGLGAFLVLVSVFALTWLGTRFGYRRKEKLGTAERLDGRTAWQVLANLAVAAGCAGLSAIAHSKAVFLLTVSAALAEAAADTVSSEVGQARSADARLISNWAVVPAGTNGGVSWMGTVAGVAAGAFVSLVSVMTGLIPFKWVGVSIVGAVAGMIADSFLGALLEQRKVLNNDAVNFLGTLIAAGAAALFV
ncbi:MAG TPA: DUF92 domain-containing protein [Terriglobales bacterium]|jgi:uncharacterized protein (TIGR00297 family)|nr:DUF92 domain-containing protein [Terriglobales bacterium]